MLARACFHDYLRPVSNSTTYSATSGVGPFYNGGSLLIPPMFAATLSRES